jgi:hypothetical protein
VHEQDGDDHRDEARRVDREQRRGPGGDHEQTAGAHAENATGRVGQRAERERVAQRVAGHEQRAEAAHDRPFQRRDHTAEQRDRVHRGEAAG